MARGGLHRKRRSLNKNGKLHSLLTLNEFAEIEIIQRRGTLQSFVERKLLQPLRAEDGTTLGDFFGRLNLLSFSLNKSKTTFINKNWDYSAMHVVDKKKLMQNLIFEELLNIITYI